MIMVVILETNDVLKYIFVSIVLITTTLSINLVELHNKKKLKLMERLFLSLSFVTPMFLLMNMYYEIKTAFEKIEAFEEHNKMNK